MCKCVGKCLLYLVNVAFILAGVALIIAGAILQYGQDLLRNTLNPVLGSVSPVEIAPIITSYLNVLGNSGLILLIFGAALAILAIIGIIGVNCNVKPVVIAYLAIIGALFIGVIVLLIFFVAKKADLYDLLNTELKKVISTEYKFNNGTNVKTDGSDPSGIIDLIQAKLECCGISNYTDFYTNPTYNATIWKKVPYSCCKMQTEITFTPVNWKCVSELDATISNYDKPCLDKLWNLVLTYSDYAVYTLAGIAGALALILILGGTVLGCCNE